VARLAKTPGEPLSWSVDGQSLLAGKTILDRNGALLAALPGANLAVEAWTPQGLFYRTSPTRGADTADTTLWLWVGGGRTRTLATDLRWDAPVRLVLPKP
jgi:uncharacterized protein with WD repeat